MSIALRQNIKRSLHGNRAVFLSAAITDVTGTHIAHATQTHRRLHAKLEKLFLELYRPILSSGNVSVTDLVR